MHEKFSAHHLLLGSSDGGKAALRLLEATLGLADVGLASTGALADRGSADTTSLSRAGAH